MITGPRGHYENQILSGVHTDPENGGKVQQDWRGVPLDDAEEPSQWGPGNDDDDNDYVMMMIIWVQEHL